MSPRFSRYNNENKWIRYDICNRFSCSDADKGKQVNIELVGLPGVGKSYLCRSIESRIRAETAAPALNTPQLNMPEIRPLFGSAAKLWRAWVFSMAHPVVAGRLFSSVIPQWTDLQRNRCSKLVNLLSEMQRSNSAPSSHSLMTEQGVLQGIWSLEMLSESSLYSDIMHHCIRWLPDVVIVIDAELVQHEKQLTHRKMGKSGFDRLHGAELRRAIERGDEKLDHILSLWTELMPECHRLDFDNRTGRDAKFLYDWLADLLR